MRKKKRWKKAGAALLTLSLLTGNVQGLLTQAEECPAIVLEEQITEQCESDQDETEQILTETPSFLRLATETTPLQQQKPSGKKTNPVFLQILRYAMPLSKS